MYYNFQQSLSEHKCVKKNNSTVRFSLKIHGLVCPFCNKKMKVTKKALKDRINEHSKRHEVDN